MDIKCNLKIADYLDISFDLNTGIYKSFNKPKTSHSRNIKWYNPPFSKNVKTNVGKHFFKLLKKHFGKHHKYHKIFNKKIFRLAIVVWTK